MEPDIDPSWEYYPETILVFPSRSLKIDLRFPLDECLREQLLNLFENSNDFHVLTSDNPYGESVDQMTNEVQHESLKKQILESRLTSIACHGMSIDGEHIEKGFAFTGSLDQARDLAEEFHQTAFFSFDGHGFTLYTPRDEQLPIRLPKS